MSLHYSLMFINFLEKSCYKQGENLQKLITKNIKSRLAQKSQPFVIYKKSNKNVIMVKNGHIILSKVTN